MLSNTHVPVRRLFVSTNDAAALLVDMNTASGGFVSTRLASKLACGERITLAFYSETQANVLEVPVVIAGRRFPHLTDSKAGVGVFVRLDEKAVTRSAPPLEIHAAA